MKKVLIFFLISFACFINLFSQVILNPSFEDSRLSSFSEFVAVSENSDIITNWKVISNKVEYISDYWVSAEGRRSIDMNEMMPGAISQSFATEIGKKYAIIFDFSGNPTCLPNLKTLEVTAANISQMYTFNIAGKSQSQMGWEKRTFEFTAISNTTNLTFKSHTEGGCGPAIDNIKIIGYDCAGVLSGSSILDSCGVCLQRDSPEMNKSCLDCKGILNGEARIDSCGNCLKPTDIGFNKSCSDCAGVLFGSSILDSCGVCLQRDSPQMNKTCLDCKGILNGEARIDSCGDCFKPTDIGFNKSCSDCAGVANGNSIIDSCGVCQPLNSAEFNKSCVDCNGTLNGSFQYNECGICLNPEDPEFIQSCSTIFVYPNIFSPNSDGINDRFILQKNTNASFKIAECSIYSRWGELVFILQEKNRTTDDFWWDGTLNGNRVEAGIYSVILLITFENGTNKTYKLDVMVAY